jgi:hypothetical protein
MTGASPFRSIPKGFAVVVVDFAIPRAIGPIPIRITVELRRTFELIFSHADAITFEARVVFQVWPWQRVVILAHS